MIVMSLKCADAPIHTTYEAHPTIRPQSAFYQHLILACNGPDNWRAKSKADAKNGNKVRSLIAV